MFDKACWIIRYIFLDFKESEKGFSGIELSGEGFCGIACFFQICKEIPDIFGCHLVDMNFLFLFKVSYKLLDVFAIGKDGRWGALFGL